LFSVQGSFTNTLLSGRVATDQPLLAFVDFSNLHVAQAQKVEPLPWAATLLNSQGGPLILAGQSDDRRVAIITFNLLQSDFPLQIDFPILVTNLSRWFLDQPLIDEEESGLPSDPLWPNPLNVDESNIRPNQAQIYGLNQTETETSSLQGQQEFWRLLAALALVILTWEWWVYWRGGGA
jgi:hypothetical protein